LHQTRCNAADKPGAGTDDEHIAARWQSFNIVVVDGSRRTYAMIDNGPEASRKSTMRTHGREHPVPICVPQPRARSVISGVTAGMVMTSPTNIGVEL
jgi:hypothetical protein